MIKLTNWETKCHCNEYDSELGNFVWCFFHKGPHPLDDRKGIFSARKILSKKCSFARPKALKDPSGHTGLME